MRQHVSCSLDTEHEGSVTVAVQFSRPACPNRSSYDGCGRAAGFSTAGSLYGYGKRRREAELVIECMMVGYSEVAPVTRRYRNLRERLLLTSRPGAFRLGTQSGLCSNADRDGSHRVLRSPERRLENDKGVIGTNLVSGQCHSVKTYAGPGTRVRLSCRGRGRLCTQRTAASLKADHRICGISSCAFRVSAR